MALLELTDKMHKVFDDKEYAIDTEAFDTVNHTILL